MAKCLRYGFRAAGLLALLVSAILANGCASTKPEVTKRFVSINPPVDGQDVSVKVFVTSIPGSSRSIKISDLSDQGQASFIEELAKHAKSGGDLVSLLGQPILPAKSASGEEDRTVFQRRLVISVENISQREGDRLADFHFFMGLDENAAKFVSWDQFATRYETVNLGILKLTQGTEIGAEIGLAPPQISEVSALGLSAKRTRNLEEAVSLTQRYVTTGTLTPGEISLLQQGAMGIDLTGNLVMDITVDVADSPNVTQLTSFSPLFDNDAVVPPDKVSIASVLVHAPAKVEGPVFVTPRYSAVTRRIESGVETYNEGDDVVTPVKSSGALKPVELVGVDDLKVSAWQLVDDRCRILHMLNRRGTKPDVILFSSFESAESFLFWLSKSRALQVRGRDLLLPDATNLARKLTDSDISKLSVSISPLNWALPVGQPCASVL